MLLPRCLHTLTVQSPLTSCSRRGNPGQENACDLSPGLGESRQQGLEQSVPLSGDHTSNSPPRWAKGPHGPAWRAQEVWGQILALCQLSLVRRTQEECSQANPGLADWAFMEGGRPAALSINRPCASEETSGEQPGLADMIGVSMALPGPCPHAKWRWGLRETAAQAGETPAPSQG